jgi:hypothetical protein
MFTIGSGPAIIFSESLFALSGVGSASEDASRVFVDSDIVGQGRHNSAVAIVFASGAVVIVEQCGAMSISEIVLVHSIVIMEMSSQSAVTAATIVVAVVCGVAARTTFEVVSKSSFDILSGRIGVVRTISGVMA